MNKFYPENPQSATPEAIDLTIDQYKDVQIEVAALGNQMVGSRLMASMAFLNNLIRCAAKAYGAIGQGFGDRKYVTSGIKRLLEPVDVTVPVTHTSSFIGRFWPGASDSATTVRRLREFFSSQLHLFTYDKLSLTKKGESWTKTTYRGFDFVRALVVYEVLEQEFISRYGFRALPKHKGFTCKLLYDAVFSKSLGMGRKGSLDDGRLPPTHAEIVMMRASMAMRSLMNQRHELASLKQYLRELRNVDMGGTELFKQIKARVEELIEKLNPLPLEELPF